MARSHLIYRQLLEVTFPSKKEAMDGQNQLSQLYSRELMPLISEVFDDLVDTSDHIRIGRLEIDIGDLPAHSFEEDLQQELRKQLEDELLKEIRRASLIQPLNEQSEGAAAESRSPGTTIYSSDRSNLDLFTFFVKTGQLPWWSGRDQVPPLEELAGELIEQQPEQLRELLKTLLPSGTYRRRIIHQFSDETLARFLGLSEPVPGWTNRIKQLHGDFSRLHRHKQIAPLNQPNFRLLLWNTAFDFWLSPGPVPGNLTSSGWQLTTSEKTESELPEKGRSPFLPKNKIQAYLLLVIKRLVETGMVVGDRENRPSRSKLYPGIRLLQQRVMKTGLQYRQLGQEIVSLADMSASKFGEIYPDHGTSKKISTGEDRQKAEAEARRLLQFEDAVVIANAGLVIIAPFLPRFFDALGLVADRAFVTDEAAERGALLLQYLATGETAMPEHELILNKILCGLSIEEPLPRRLQISEHEEEEVENLLQSVVEHWEALKSTSPEGLRQTFLVREGLLAREQNGWKLSIERTTVDVLLDQLPWSISIIKLPWNEEMLHVEW